MAVLRLKYWRVQSEGTIGAVLSDHDVHPLETRRTGITEAFVMTFSIEITKTVAFLILKNENL